MAVNKETELLNEINKNEIINSKYNSKILAEEKIRNDLMVISEVLR